jgi:diphthine-ammonia ligase
LRKKVKSIIFTILFGVIFSMNTRRAAVSFTGGKDCTLSLHRAINDGSISVVLLVTFAPLNSKPCKLSVLSICTSYCCSSTYIRLFSFLVLAHPIDVVKAQSLALGISHKMIFVEAPYLNSYRQRIQELANEYAIELLITGQPVRM